MDRLVNSLIMIKTVLIQQAAMCNGGLEATTSRLRDSNGRLQRKVASQQRTPDRQMVHPQQSKLGGDMFSRLMERKQLCAVSTLHQPRRHTNNATYLAKDSRYGYRRLTIKYPGIVQMGRHQPIRAE